MGKSIRIKYTISVWKMFEDDGSELDQETAITRIPIWSVRDLTRTEIDFDTGSAKEELVGGRQYCWQVQAFDYTDNPISQKNDGKSDVWQFTIKFTPLTINQPIL